MRTDYADVRPSDPRPDLPVGEYGGETRAGVMARLLAKAEAQSKLKAEPQPKSKLFHRITSALGLALQLAIVSNMPKLTPAQAAEVLRQSPADSNMTLVMEARRAVSLDGRGQSGTARPVPRAGDRGNTWHGDGRHDRGGDHVLRVARPLNCCDTYVMPLPYVNVRIVK